MRSIQKISPCLWFDHQAEQAASFYTGIFPNSKICKTSYYGEEGRDVTHMEPGTALMVSFELEGQSFAALNGGPVFKFNEAISFIVNCDTQEEIDYYWERLGDGGDPAAQQCGWLKDKFGASWQVVPRVLQDMMTDTDPVKSQRVMAALMKMRKLDLNALKRAFNGTV